MSSARPQSRPCRRTRVWPLRSCEDDTSLSCQIRKTIGRERSYFVSRLSSRSCREIFVALQYEGRSPAASALTPGGNLNERQLWEIEPSGRHRSLAPSSANSQISSSIAYSKRAHAAIARPIAAAWSVSIYVSRMSSGSSGMVWSQRCHAQVRTRTTSAPPKRRNVASGHCCERRWERRPNSQGCATTAPGSSKRKAKRPAKPSTKSG